MAAKLTAALASKCLFVDNLSEIEPKKTLVPFPYGKIAIGSKLVFKNKKDKRGTTTKNKARLVAQGYSWEEGIDYDKTFTPVARMEAIRIFFAFATYMNKVYQIVIKSPFLNGKLKEEVYVKQPPGFKSSEFPDYVCKLGKALSKLKQAPRACKLKEEVYVKQPPGFESSEFPDYVCKLDKALYELKQAPRACFMCKVSVKSKGITSNSCEKNTQTVLAITWIEKATPTPYYKMVPIFCDNTSAIAISNNLVLHSGTKHIDIRYHFIRDHILKGDIELHFIPTEYQLADIFTKPLDEPTFISLKAKLEQQTIKYAPQWNNMTMDNVNFQTNNVFEKLMTKKFEMSMMGELTYFLGLQIKQDDKGMSICQEQYTRNLLKKYDICDSSSVKTPMVPPNSLGPDLASKPVNDLIQGNDWVTDALISKHIQTQTMLAVTWIDKTLQDPSKDIEIELTTHIIAMNNQKDLVSPSPLVAKPKKGKSQTVTLTSPKSQGLEALRALSKKSKRPMSKKPSSKTKVTPPKPTKGSE
nr:retrovirus-related Pol polyprotein from transposon TNT 1-94 [Tanacetum cinerariifolium]